MLRRLLTLSLLALVADASSLAQGAVARSVGSAEVVAVQPARVADLVLLGRGFDAGFREGMICRISRADAKVADIVLVEIRSTCASALIVDLAPGQGIRAGDIASVKILKT